MKIYLLLLPILIPLGASGHDEWILFATNGNGNKYWVDRGSLKEDGTNMRVWARERYSEKLGGVAGACLTHYSINCEEYSIRILESTFYSDKNWKSAIQTEKSNHKTTTIPRDSAWEILATIVCN